MVSDLEKSSDCLCVSPCVSPTEPTKVHATHTNNFFRYFEESTLEKSIDSIDQMQKNAFDVIGKRTSDQTTNHPKKSKKRTSHILGNYFFNLHNKIQNTQQLVLSQSSDKKKTHIAAETKGIKIYTEKQINDCTGLTKKYRKFWNAKAEAICNNKKYNGWSKTSIEGVVNCSWVLKKITLLNEDVRLLEIKITELRNSDKQLNNLPDLKTVYKNLDRMKTIASSLEKSEKANQGCMIKLNEVNSSAERAALKTEIVHLRSEIDGSYGNLKLAQDALRKKITAAEKVVEKAENQNNSQHEFLPTASLSLDEEQITAEEVKINIEYEETEKKVVQNDKFRDFQ